MSDEEELSADEMDALLRDLEAKADASSSKSPKKSKDVDAFLAEDKPAKKKTKTKPKPKQEPLPKPAPKAELATVEEPESKKKKGKENKEKAPKVVQRGTDDELQKKLNLALLALVTPVAMAAIWILGSYLGPIVSAGWLIAINALVAVLAGAIGLKLAVKRGKLAAWAGLVSAGLLAALLAISPNFAGQRIVQYGHWPASAVGQLLGWSADNFLIKTSVSISSSFGRTMLPDPVDGAPNTGPVARRLGTVDPLTPKVVPVDPTPPADVQPKETQPKETQPKEATPPTEPEGNPL